MWAGCSGLPKMGEVGVNGVDAPSSWSFGFRAPWELLLQDDFHVARGVVREPDLEHEVVARVAGDGVLEFAHRPDGPAVDREDALVHLDLEPRGRHAALDPDDLGRRLLAVGVVLDAEPDVEPRQGGREVRPSRRETARPGLARIRRRRRGLFL